MRLKTKLVVSATALTFAIVLVMSTIFVGELLRQRIEQTTSATEVLAHQIVLVTLQALETGVRANPPKDRSEDALRQSAVNALKNNDALVHVMNAIVRYSLTVQDVSVTDTAGVTLVSTDPDAVGQRFPTRAGLARVRESNFVLQTKELFGGPRVLDLSESIQRNGKPFLSVHLGVRSTFLRASYEPWLRTALIFTAMAGFTSMAAAALLANLALNPIEQISRQLEHLGMVNGAEGDTPEEEEADRAKPDTVVRVTRSIDRLGEQMRTQEAGYTALRTNLDKMLDTLRDGVLLFTEDGRAAMASDAAAHFLNKTEDELVGSSVGHIFDQKTALGAAVRRAFDSGRTVSGESVTVEDGSEVQFSLDRIHDAAGSGQVMGTLVTLRDVESAAQLEQELEVSRRLAAVGRLTAGVGHEVKNPINAMVVHLELLKSKLATMEGGSNGAQRHVEILAGEMQRLDRVVQTLADFSRPMELHLADRDLRGVVAAVVELTGAEMEADGIRLLIDVPNDPVTVRVDAELMRQALLNLVLNGMQAMPGGGDMRITLRRDHHFAVLTVQDRGEGIAEDVLPRIFDLYFTTKARGSGIGLAMTYRILQMHGGALEVRSLTDVGAADRGTTFTLRLPVLFGAGEMRKTNAMAGRGVRGVGEQA